MILEKLILTHKQIFSIKDIEMINPLIDEVKDLLEERKLEVDRHLQFAKALVDFKANAIAHKPTINNNDDDVVISDYEIDRSLIKTISATGYLLIYNLLESTMTAALDAVHTQLHNDKITFEQLNDNLQKICISNFKGAVNTDSMKELKSTAINSALVQLGYDSSRLWNGNVDVRKIKQKAKDYGFKYDYTGEDYDDLKRNFLNIKDKRNALAHGRLSFEQCGQDTAVDALIEYSQQAYVYLEAVLNGMNAYLEQQLYRVST